MQRQAAEKELGKHEDCTSVIYFRFFFYISDRQQRSSRGLAPDC